MTTPVTASPVPTIDRAALEQRVADLSLYSESGDAVSDGEIWYVPETAEVFGADGFTFQDFLDVINPLHHLPVIGTLYRAITDDEIAPAPRVIGGALFGGIAGFVAGLVNAVVEDETGSDLGEKALALIGVGDDTTALAQKTAAAGPTADKIAPATETAATIESSVLPAAASGAAVQPIVAAAAARAPEKPGAIGGAGAPTVSPLAASKLTRQPPSPAGGGVPATTAATAGIAGFALTDKTRSTAPPPGVQTPTRSAHAGAPSAPISPLPADHGNSRLAAQAAPAAAVPKLMREALDKYDVLMRDRRPPTVSGDF
ncbi:MAG: hypothetical protein MJE12_26330 [Alphaproteobacteria bacterium]|nr:hypothetical protein [Alphaproteobacteria bacterium]